MWTDEVVASLHQLNDAGLSASQIARELNGKYRTSYSRNAVISKLHRMSSPPMTSNEARRPKPRIAERLAAPAFEPREFQEPPADGMELLDLGSQNCRYVLPNGKFCGHRVVPGRSWCLDHYCRVFQRVADDALTKAGA